MNALYAIYKYMDIKSGNKPKTPITMVFGAKAAPAYIIAKDIIHLILCLQELIDNDPEVSPYFKVIMLENYNVSKAAKVIPAADISEQISLASKEASGTGNMKFMLNGALTLGTEDGANVEIGDLVGKENIYIFGKNRRMSSTCTQMLLTAQKTSMTKIRRLQSWLISSSAMSFLLSATRFAWRDSTKRS